MLISFDKNAGCRNKRFKKPTFVATPSTTDIIAGYGVSNDGSQFTIAIRTVPGFLFAVDRSSDLSTWTTVEENISGTGNIVQFIDATIDGESEFYYRVRIQ